MLKEQSILLTTKQKKTEILLSQGYYKLGITRLPKNNRKRYDSSFIVKSANSLYKNVRCSSSISRRSLYNHDNSIVDKNQLLPRKQNSHRYSGAHSNTLHQNENQQSGITFSSQINDYKIIRSRKASHKLGNKMNGTYMSETSINSNSINRLRQLLRRNDEDLLKLQVNVRPAIDSSGGQERGTKYSQLCQGSRWSECAVMKHVDVDKIKLKMKRDIKIKKKVKMGVKMDDRMQKTQLSSSSWKSGLINQSKYSVRGWQLKTSQFNQKQQLFQASLSKNITEY